MIMSVSVTVLSTLPFFSNLDESDLAAISNAGVCKFYAAKQQVLEGAISFQHLLVVITGQLLSISLAEDGRLVGQSNVNPGDTIGWLSIIDGQPVNAHLSAKTDCEILFIPAQIARTLATTHPMIAERVLNGFALNIRRLTTERHALAQPSAFQRIFVHILNVAGGDADLSRPTSLPKQQEIAVMTNTSRETVSRALQILIKNGVLKKNGHTILIEKKHVLQQLAHDGPSALAKLE